MTIFGKLFLNHIHIFHVKKEEFEESGKWAEQNNYSYGRENIKE